MRLRDAADARLQGREAVLSVAGGERELFSVPMKLPCAVSTPSVQALHMVGKLVFETRDGAVVARPRGQKAVFSVAGGERELCSMPMKLPSAVQTTSVQALRCDGKTGEAVLRRGCWSGWATSARTRWCRLSSRRGACGQCWRRFAGDECWRPLTVRACFHGTRCEESIRRGFQCIFFLGRPALDLK